MNVFSDHDQSNKRLLNQLKKYVASIVGCNDISKMSVNDYEIDSVKVMPDPAEPSDLLVKIKSNEGIIITVLLSVIVFSFGMIVYLVSKVGRRPGNAAETQTTAQHAAPLAQPESSSLQSD